MRRRLMMMSVGVGLALVAWLGIRAVEARRLREELARAREEFGARRGPGEAGSAGRASTRRRRGCAPAGRLREDAWASRRRPGRVGSHPRWRGAGPFGGAVERPAGAGAGPLSPRRGLPPPGQPSEWRRRRRGMATPRVARLDDGPAR